MGEMRKISRTTLVARIKRYGVYEVWFCPSKAYPVEEHPFNMAIKQIFTADDLVKKEGELMSVLDRSIHYFRFYNCNAETGKMIHFYEEIDYYTKRRRGDTEEGTLSLRDVSAQEVEVMRTALGLNQKKKPYRNRYVVIRESDQLARLEELGFVSCYEEDQKHKWYRVTLGGLRALYRWNVSRKYWEKLKGG